MKKIIVTIVFIVIAVILGIKGKELLNKKENEIKNEKIPLKAMITVQVVSPTTKTIEKKVSYLAQIIPDKEIKLSTKLVGYIKNISVKESQKVKKGDILIKIDSKELKSNIKALKSTLKAQIKELDITKSIYERNKKLYKIGGLAKEKLDISKVAVDAKRAVVENSRQKLNQLNHQLSYLNIKAPYDGVIDTIFLHKGDLATTGRAILSMTNNKKRLVISYASSKIKEIKKGEKVFLDNKIIGEINFIYTSSKNGLVSAEIKLEKSINLPIGTSAFVDVLIKKARGCVIDDGTVLHKKDGTFVMVYNGKVFSPMKIKIKMKEKNLLLIYPCPKGKIAKASESKLAELPAFSKVDIEGENR